MDMLPAYKDVDALLDAIDAFDEAMLEAREGELAVLQAEEEAVRRRRRLAGRGRQRAGGARRARCDAAL